MDFLDPVLGSVAGLDAGQWKTVFVFTVKGVLFCLPFVILGVLVERDVYRVPFFGRIIKTLVLILVVFPVLAFALLNYFAPRLSENFWADFPWLENLWIMEGSLPSLVLALLCGTFLTIYLGEVWKGCLRD